MLHTILAGACAGFAGVVISATVTGWLFHRFQARTPGTWRPAEGPLQYAAASALTFVAAASVVALFSLGGDRLLVGDSWLLRGTAFGMMCWAALIAPVLLSLALFVNWHRGFLVGLLIDWLLVMTAAGAIAAYFAG